MPHAGKTERSSKADDHHSPERADERKDQVEEHDDSDKDKGELVATDRVHVQSPVKDAP